MLYFTELETAYPAAAEAIDCVSTAAAGWACSLCSPAIPAASGLGATVSHDKHLHAMPRHSACLFWHLENKKCQLQESNRTLSICLALGNCAQASGPVVCMVWTGVNVVLEGRKMLGATKPSESAMGTIRGDFCIE